MHNVVLAGVIIGMVGLWVLVVRENRRRVSRYVDSGRPQAGIVVFVEPVRWLFIVWGFNAVCTALRLEGLCDAVHLFRWSRAAGSLLVLPDLMRRHRLDTKASRLARQIETLIVAHPGVPVHVVAYSTGVYIAFEAIRQLMPGPRLASVVALHGTVSPGYDVSDVARRTKRMLTVHGRNDWLINGVGPWLFGTNDRIHSPACGLIGFRNVPPNVHQHAWRPVDRRQGYWGDHFTVMAIPWLRAHLVPILAASSTDHGESEAPSPG